MPIFDAETVFCIARIERATAQAQAAADSCARASHIGIATVYRQRSAGLRRNRLFFA